MCNVKKYYLKIVQIGSQNTDDDYITDRKKYSMRALLGIRKNIKCWLLWRKKS